MSSSGVIYACKKRTCLHVRVLLVCVYFCAFVLYVSYFFEGMQIFLYLNLMYCDRMR